MRWSRYGSYFGEAHEARPAQNTDARAEGDRPGRRRPPGPKATADAVRPLAAAPPARPAPQPGPAPPPAPTSGRSGNTGPASLAAPTTPSPCQVGPGHARASGTAGPTPRPPLLRRPAARSAPRSAARPPPL